MDQRTCVQRQRRSLPSVTGAAKCSSIRATYFVQIDVPGCTITALALGVLRRLRQCADEAHVVLQIVLRTLNRTRSAFVTVTLGEGFFTHFEVRGEVEKCKILLKVTCAPFLRRNHNRQIHREVDAIAS